MRAAALRAGDLGVEVRAPRQASDEEILRIHDVDYLRDLEARRGRATAIDPDGSVYVFSRNIPAGPGRIVLPLPSQRVAFSAAPPRGFHRVRAHFTPERTDETVTFRGRYGDGEWTSAITLEIRAYPVRDVEETYLYIR